MYLFLLQSSLECTNLQEYAKVKRRVAELYKEQKKEIEEVLSYNKIESLSSVKLNLLNSIIITSVFLADCYLFLLGKLNFD